MHGITLASFGLIWVTLVCVSVGQIFLKLGVGTEKIPVGSSFFATIGNILGAMLRPKAIIGFGFYVVGTFIWLLVLSRVALSIAFPMFSMSYFLVVILSATVLKERVDWRFAIIGLILISIGVTCIGLSSPKGGNREQGIGNRGHRAQGIGHRITMVRDLQSRTHLHAAGTAIWTKLPMTTNLSSRSRWSGKAVGRDV
ncbi:MAG: hypothetical protein M1133_14130 [Armatimonadetes bacterium]|nr:hypothetical protein [Armatimonadota bacterium]